MLQLNFQKYRDTFYLKKKWRDLKREQGKAGEWFKINARNKCEYLLKRGATAPKQFAGAVTSAESETQPMKVDKYSVLVKRKSFPF